MMYEMCLLGLSIIIDNLIYHEYTMIEYYE